MVYDFLHFKARVEAVQEWLSKELRTIQTGRGTPALLDGVLVESFDSKVPIKHVASMTVKDARTIQIVPWNTDEVQKIERSLRESGLGISVTTDERGVLVSFPELTTETREKYVKMVKGKLEEARVSLRAERDKIWHALQTEEREGQISTDEKFRSKEEMEKITKEGSQTLGKLAERKEKEVMS